MVKHLELDKAVDYLIDETLEGAPFRDDADLCRLSDRQRSDRWEKRRRFSLPLIVKACAEGRWKATGKKPGSAEREHIPDIAFIGSEIDQYTGDLMSTVNAVFIDGGTGLRRGRIGRRRKVAIWTELMFSVPSGADEGGPAEKVWEAFDKRQNALTFNRGEFTHIAGEIAEATGYKQNTVEKMIRRDYRDLKRKKKQTPT